MELIGRTVEEKGLTGNENLKSLVNIFTEGEAIFDEKRLLLPKMKEYVIKNVSRAQEGIRKNIEGLAESFPLPSEAENIKKAMNYLIADYFCVEFGMKYDRISSELFDINRIIPSYVEKAEKVMNVEIPLFAAALFGQSSLWKFEDSVEDDKYNREYKFSVSSVVPPITKEVREKARQAKADYLKIYSKALEKQYIGDLLLQNVDSFNQSGNFKLKTYWIPSPSELDIKVDVIDKDPILVAELYDKYYLVAAWNVYGEQPYEHYLKEFTEEKAGK